MDRHEWVDRQERRRSEEAQAEGLQAQLQMALQLEEAAAQEAEQRLQGLAKAGEGGGVRREAFFQLLPFVCLGFGSGGGVLRLAWDTFRLPSSFFWCVCVFWFEANMHTPFRLKSKGKPTFCGSRLV